MLRFGGAVVSVMLALLSGLSPWVQAWEAQLRDAQFRFLREYAPRPATDQVVVVGFDESTIKALPEPLALWHAHLGSFLQAMASAQAAAVGLDMVLPDRSFDTVLPGQDRLLIRGIVLARRAAPLVLARTLEPTGRARPIHRPLLSAAGDQALGYALLPIDADGVVRRFDERLAQDADTVDTFAGQLARRLGLPVRQGLIDYAAGATMGFIPLQDVLAWQRDGETDRLHQAFAGKVVLLGSTLTFEDRHRVPAPLAAWDLDNRMVSGVLIHAQVLRNLLSGGLVQPVASWLTPLLVVLAAVGWFWVPRAAIAALAFGAMAVAAWGVSTFALHHGLAVSLLPVLIAAGLSLGGRQAIVLAQRLRERGQMRRVFAGYVSPAVMDEILADKIVPALGGEQKFACVMFSDIRGYTTRSESMSPQQTIAFLNRYFDRVVPIIHDHGGTVVSFMGDGIMAVFGVPKSMAQPCAAAVGAAQAMLQAVEQMNAEFGRDHLAPIRIGVGLHAGEGVAGHIGSASRHEYSVIGDVTNVAARLEGVTKEVGYDLVVSRAVIDHLSDCAGFSALGKRAIKGRAAVEVYGFGPTEPHLTP